MKSIGIIGKGKMGSAFMKAFSNYDVTSSDKDESNIDVVNKSEIIFLCVKPQDIKDVVTEIKDHINDKIVVSIAAGIKLSYLEENFKKVVRVMPNVACLVNEMAAGYSIGKNVTSDEQLGIHEILNKAGKAYLLDDKQINLITPLNGSSPAYIALFVKSLINAVNGVDADISKKLVVQTLKGTAKMLDELSPDELIKMVASKKGATEQGLKTLEENNFEDIIIKTVESTIKKTEDLGK